MTNAPKYPPEGIEKPVPPPPPPPKQSAKPDWLKDMTVLSLRPDDVIVLKMEALDPNALDQATNCIKEVFGQDQNVLVTRGMDIGVIRKDGIVSDDPLKQIHTLRTNNLPTGWVCPRCQRANSPDTHVCECSLETEHSSNGAGMMTLIEETL